MEKSTLTTAYVSNIYDTEHSILISRWYTFPYTEENEFKKLVRNYFEDIKQYQPKSILLDSTQAQFVIGPDMQTWIVENFHYLYNGNGVLKMGVLVNDDIFMSLSIEQTMEEDVKSILEVHYFYNEISALEWLYK